MYHQSYNTGSNDPAQKLNKSQAESLKELNLGHPPQVKGGVIRKDQAESLLQRVTFKESIVDSIQ